MWKSLPDWVVPWELARLNRRLEGQVPLIRMGRLAQEFLIQDNFAQVKLTFDCGEGGRCFVQGRIKAQLPLTCQRCLEPLVLPLDFHTRLGLMVAETELARWPDDYEPWIVQPEEAVSLWHLVEEELFLALPLVARHPPGECRQPLLEEAAGIGETDEGAYGNPFAALKKFKN